MPVAQRPQEPGFRPILFDVCPQRRADVAARVELGIRRLAQELIRHPDLEVDAIVHRADEAVTHGPLLGVHLRQADVAPADDRLVGRQLLVLPKEPQVLRESFIDALNVGVPGRALLAADRESRVYTRDERFIRAGIAEDIGVGRGALRLQRQVRARGDGKSQESGGDGQRLVNAVIHGSVPSPVVSVRSR